MVGKLSFHMVGAEVARHDLSFIVENRAFTLSLVVAPFAIVDLARGLIKLTTLDGPLALDILANIDISGHTIDKSTLTIFAVLLPASFEHRSL